MHRARIISRTCTELKVGGAQEQQFISLTLAHCVPVISEQGTTYLRVFPSSSSANLELTDAREAQVPANVASMKLETDIF